MTASGVPALLTVPTALLALLEEADISPGPVDEMALAGKLNAAITDPSSLSAAERRGAFAEIEALRFQRPYVDDRSSWGAYWCSLTSWTDNTGKQHQSPDALDADEDVIAHWIARAQTSKHPVLRARYADLAWEIGRLLKRRSKDAGTSWTLPIPHTLALLAIDACLGAVNLGMAETEYDAWQLLDRATGLTIAMNDPARVLASKDALFSYYRKLSGAAKHQWWRFDDITWERGKALGMTEGEELEVVQVLEAALDRHSDKSKPEVFDPHDATMAADRLARRLGNAGRERTRAAVKKAALAFEGVAKEADGLLATAWLEPLIPRYRQAGLPEDAIRVEQTIRSRAQEAMAEMKHIEVPVDIPKEQLDEWTDRVAGTSLPEGLNRIAGACLLREASTQRSLKNMTKNAPLVSMMPSMIMGSGGFTVAQVGSVRDDLDGRTMQHAAELLNWHAPWLYSAFNRAKEKHGLDGATLLAELSKAPQFPLSRDTLLREGLNAWATQDSIKAIHVLVPQLEAALRDVLTALGASVMEHRAETRGFEAIGLGRILHHPRFVEKVPTDVRFHLRALYSDARSINLRNRLAHGLVHPGLLGMGVANWVVHSLIVVGMLRVTPAQPHRPISGEC